MSHPISRQLLRAWRPSFALILALLVGAAPLSAQHQVEWTPPPTGYLTPEALDAELLELEKTYGRLELGRLGQSPEGRTIWLCTFRSPQYAQKRPEAMIVANLEGDKPVATEMAMALIRKIASSGGAWAPAGTLHIVPNANPDAYARAMAGLPPTRGKPIDEDRDGRTDENGPSDLDGDGQVLWIRQASPAGQWTANRDDDRAMEPRVSAEPQQGAYHLRREGWDEDGDGQFLEDPHGGIRLENNYPHLWPQYDPAAGPYPLSEPESRALAKFVLARKKLAWVFVLDDEDNLAETKEAGDEVGMGSTDPLAKDAAFYRAWGKRIYPKPVEGKEGFPKAAAGEHGQGNFADWAYNQRGLFVLESSVWTIPDQKPKDDHSLEWLRLKWADKTYGQRAFRAWIPFDHPEMGPIEIGGWNPLVFENPPAEQVPALAERYIAFVNSLANDFAKLEWAEVKVKALDGLGVYEVSAKLVNVGFLPTISAMGEKNRAMPKIKVEWQLSAGAEVLVGKAVQHIDRLDGGGGFEEIKWILRVPPNAAMPHLLASCPTASSAEHTFQD